MSCSTGRRFCTRGDRPAGGCSRSCECRRGAQNAGRPVRHLVMRTPASDTTATSGFETGSRHWCIATVLAVLLPLTQLSAQPVDAGGTLSGCIADISGQPLQGVNRRHRQRHTSDDLQRCPRLLRAREPAARRLLRVCANAGLREFRPRPARDRARPPRTGRHPDAHPCHLRVRRAGIDGCVALEGRGRRRPAAHHRARARAGGGSRTSGLDCPHRGCGECLEAASEGGFREPQR